MSFIGWVLLGIGLTYMLFVHLFISRLKKEHNGVWKSLGEPRTFEISPVITFRVLKYACSAKVTRLPDETLFFIVWGLRLLLLALLAIYLTHTIAIWVMS